MNALQRFSKIVPAADEEQYAAIPQESRDELDRIIPRLDALLGARSLWGECVLSSTIVGMPAKKLYTRMRAYMKSKNWRDLIDKRKCAALWETAKPIGLPASFINFYKGLCEDNQRNNAGGYRALMKIWKTHYGPSTGTTPPKCYASIPGYDEWPKEAIDGVPGGWSKRNLSRFGPDYYDSAAARIGPFAASLFRPPVKKTRHGLAVLEKIEFDDHEWNLKVHFPGQRLAMRPRGFVAVDHLSGFSAFSMKPTLWDLANEKKLALTETDMMWFSIHWLTNYGFRTDEVGTEFVTENGTAALRKLIAERICRATDGHVRINPSGLITRAAHHGQFNPRGKGNFKDKPHVETGFNLIDNYFAGLDGQVGLNRLTAPEEMHGREAYLQSLLKAAEKLPQERSELLRLPVLTWTEFQNQAMDLMQALAASREHSLEGWAVLGYEQIVFRIPLPDGSFTPWQPKAALLQMPDPQRLAIEAMISQDNSGALTKAVNLSRQEVFEMEYRKAEASGLIQRISPWRYCELMGLENGYEVTVGKQSLITIESRDFGTRPLHYIARINGRHLPVGEKYMAFVNPWSPRLMLLCKGNGSALGICELWDVPAANDVPGQVEMLKKQSQWESERRFLLNERHADRAADIQHMREHNAAIVDQSADEKASEKSSEEKETADLAALARSAY
jgi:hypothetical protein